MTLGEYLDEHDLNYCDVVLKKENGEVITDYGCLIQYCNVLKIEDNELTIR
jgi:hypothetical protein